MKIRLTNTPTWQALIEHQKIMAHFPMRQLFNEDPNRFNKFSLKAAGLFLDYSKNIITESTLSLLGELAENTQLTEQIEHLFKGEKINRSENRAALHTALRQSDHDELFIDNKNIIPDIRACQQKMKAIVESVHQQQWRGFNNQPIKDVVNIGIGGSDLGAQMAVCALKPYAKSYIRCHFISNIDGTQLNELLTTLNPATTLFIISSKTFTTQETLHNAKSAKQWLTAHAGKKENLNNHFLAVTANKAGALSWGISEENILPLWSWVGGRFSLWSAVGLPLALWVGFEHFQELLKGAHEMDIHFRTAPFLQNMPVILALLSIWYVNFFDATTQAIIPYDHLLQWLPSYLQQAHMESHGKQTNQHGDLLDYPTGPVIWGGIGTNGQHTFHQLLHQGTHVIPVDFIVCAQAHHSLAEHHAMLFANCLSQSQALMQGKNEEEIFNELLNKGMTEEQIKQLTPHQKIPGNRPSNTIVLSRLTPFTLGALLALYEHKIFTQGVIWNINNFDQWGVELGKQLVPMIMQDLQQSAFSHSHDASTTGLMDYYKTALQKDD